MEYFYIHILIPTNHDHAADSYPMPQLTSSNGGVLLFSCWDACDPKQGSTLITFSF